MLSKSNNREILVALTKRYEFSTNVATFDSSGNILDLDLSSVGLTTFPLEIVQLTNLQMLNLSKNKLSQLPPGIEQLVNLEPLYISGNQTKQFMIALSHLPQLKELVITFNDLIFKEKFSKNYAKNEFQLDRLPPELGQLTNLQRLDLSTNQ